MKKKITLYLYVNCDIVFIQNDRNLTKHYNVKTFYIDNLDFAFFQIYNGEYHTISFYWYF